MTKVSIEMDDYSLLVDYMVADILAGAQEFRFRNETLELIGFNVGQVQRQADRS